ncbi:MAG: transferase [Candidatus Aminicenantes bacterium]|nr:transferase [Candidatus Aminicenantes bacterium]
MVNQQSRENPLSRIYPRVRLGDKSQIGDFCVIGLPAGGHQPGEVETIIGDDAIIRSHTVIYAGNRIGSGFRAGHGVLIREDNQIGHNCSIGSHTVIEHHLQIGNGVRIHSQAFVPEFTILEDGCWIGPNVVFTNAYHPLCPKVKQCLKGATVKRGAKVGANATILPDLEIGEFALVGAGAVVIGNVPAYSVVAGNPAKVVKKIADLTCPYDLIDHPYPMKPEK